MNFSQGVDTGKAKSARATRARKREFLAFTCARGKFFAMADQFSKDLSSGVEKRGNIVLAILAGLVAAILGAVLWMGVDVGLQMHLGLIAIAIGFMVGFAIRFAGHGGSPIYGII